MLLSLLPLPFLCIHIGIFRARPIRTELCPMPTTSCLRKMVYDSSIEAFLPQRRRTAWRWLTLEGGGKKQQNRTNPLQNSWTNKWMLWDSMKEGGGGITKEGNVIGWYKWIKSENWEAAKRERKSGKEKRTKKKEKRDRKSLEWKMIWERKEFAYICGQAYVLRMFEKLWLLCLFLFT